jgi:hypothetical protein
MQIVTFHVKRSLVAPVISPLSGPIHDTDPITITCETPDAIIRYTVNGSDPNETSPIYSSPFTVSADTTVKARSYKPGGGTPSSITTVSYILVPRTDTFYVTSNDNDGYVQNGTTLNTSSSLLYCGYNSPNTYETVFLIDNVDVSQGATITTANLKLWMPTGGNNGYYISPESQRWVYVCQDSSATMVTSASEYNSKDWGSYYYAWQVNHWCCYNQWLTANIASVVQPVINLPDWSFGNNLLIKVITYIWGTGKNIRDFAGYGLSGLTYTPTLEITWE